MRSAARDLALSEFSPADDPPPGGARTTAPNPGLPGSAGTSVTSLFDVELSGAVAPSSAEESQWSAERGGFTVHVHLHTADTQPPAGRWLADQMGRAAEVLQLNEGQLDLSIIDDAHMQQLHAEHCDDPTTTDVLTFDLREDDADPLEGDLMLCRDEAQRQAMARGHEARQELLLYAVHGLLHLLGEDDHEDAAYARMHQREDQLLTAMGLGPLFSVRTSASLQTTGLTQNVSTGASGGISRGDG